MTTKNSIKNRNRTRKARAHQPRKAAAWSLGLALLANASWAFAGDEHAGWELTAGIGVASVPRYLGSGDDRILPVPMLGARHGRFVFGDVPGGTSPASVGIHLVETASWNFGTFVSYDLGDQRKESVDSHLHGLGDIKPTGHAGFFAGYSVAWLALRASAQSDIGGKDQGMTASFEAMAQFPLSQRLFVGAGPSLTWADQSRMQTFFAVDAAQSANSGLAQYSTRAGLQSVDFSLLAMYQVSTHWSMGARVAATRLQQEAADSPVVEDDTQLAGMMFFNYRF